MLLLFQLELSRFRRRGVGFICLYLGLRQQNVPRHLRLRSRPRVCVHMYMCTRAGVVNSQPARAPASRGFLIPPLHCCRASDLTVPTPTDLPRPESQV